MEEKKKKKKLTLTTSVKTTHNVSHYTPSRGKTSVVIEKKAYRRKWFDKKIQSKDNNLGKIEIIGKVIDTNINILGKEKVENTNFDFRYNNENLEIQNLNLKYKNINFQSKNKV